MKRLFLAMLLSVLAAFGCGPAVKNETTSITAPQNEQKSTPADNFKIPLLLIKDFTVGGHYLQKCWYWRGFWDIETNSISLEDAPLIEPLEAMAGGYNNYHFAWDGGNQLILTHSISNKNAGILNFASGSVDFSIDTYMVNTLPGRDYAISFSSVNRQSTYTVYTGELDLTILCRSKTGNHWNLSFVGKHVTPLLITEQGVEEPGVLLANRDKNGGQNLSWLSVKGGERKWFSIGPDVPGFLCSSTGDFPVGACTIGGKVYLSGSGGKIYSFSFENRDRTTILRSVPEEGISNIITAEWAKNPPAYLKYAKLGAYHDILLVSINGADGNDRIFAFREKELLARLILNKDVVENYLGVILPMENYGAF